LYVVAVNTTNNTKESSFDHKTLRFWMQAKAMGSKLIVGVPSSAGGASGGSSSNKDAVTDMVLNACACSSVDEVITEAPAKVDLMFLEKQGIDYVILPATTSTSAAASNYVTDEVMNAQCVLSIGTDGVARPVLAKGANKSE
jgi:glycerol-3-phosphate cytidylyltransferase-like family protein